MQCNIKARHKTQNSNRVLKIDGKVWQWETEVIEVKTAQLLHFAEIKQISGVTPLEHRHEIYNKWAALNSSKAKFGFLLKYGPASLTFSGKSQQQYCLKESHV